ncbi:MAG: hypothetical protein SGBAC_000224 [Bacillariaceae sp.]
MLTQGEEIHWDSEVEGVSAISLLWQRSSQMIENSRVGSSEIIVLPGASLQLVQNWVEIAQWMGDGEDSLLRATLLTSESSGVSIPTVRIELLGKFEEDIGDDLEPIANTDSADVLNDRTRSWVQRILVEQGICPFTKSVTKSGHGLSDVGVPVGTIAYHASFAEDAFRLFADTWKAIDEMIEAGPSGKTGVSSILLAAPAFDDDFDFWAGPIFAMLEASVVAAQAQEQIGVVCFHPQYATPDGKSWPGFGHMHSLPRLQKWYQEHSESNDLTTDDIAAGGAWQRRTPHATINVLRADQLEAAESKRMSGVMYTENIEKLICSIGSSKLADDLEQERQLF